MSKLVSIHSYRGGTGKSNVAANVAYLMAAQGQRVAVLDTDLQSPGVHMVLGFEQERMTFSLSDFLFGKCDIEECAYDLTQQHDIEGRGRLVLLPSSMSLESISRVVAEGYDPHRLNTRIRELTHLLDLDVLLIDTHPGLSRESMLTTAVSDVLLLLLRPDTQDFHGTAVVLQVADRLGVPCTYLLANKVVASEDRALLEQRVQQAYGRELIGLLPLSDDMASLGSRGLICRTIPDHPISVELRRVADKLLQCGEAEAGA